LFFACATSSTDLPGSSAVEEQAPNRDSDTTAKNVDADFRYIVIYDKSPGDPIVQRCLNQSREIIDPFCRVNTCLYKRILNLLCSTAGNSSMLNVAENTGIVHIVLTHRQPMPTFEDEVVEQFGFQDKKQNVMPPTAKKDGYRFTCDIDVTVIDKQAQFSGPYVHGTPQQRSLYVSWKRADPSRTPWVQRIKIPLNVSVDLLMGAIGTNKSVVADITGRGPHDTTPIAWTLQS
jgi:hypothetical protein